MKMLPLFHSGISLLLYSFLLLIIGLSLWQFVHMRYRRKENEPVYFRSVVPLGWASMAFGFVGLFMDYTEAFAEIEAAGDISPAIVASALKFAMTYPALGFLCLGTSYVLRFINQNPAKATRLTSENQADSK